ADFLVKSGLIHRCLQFNQAEISGYWHPSGADMPLSGDLGKEQEVRYRSKVLMAHFLGGRLVRVVWCEFKSESGHWKKA
ncbi:hypothetical protein, partial [Thiolapillus sp.]|uniref:hypothetical protein n=1 Tax=Thiolapillus sp. TaxID=2017437 RepID=UPI0025FC39B4